MTLPSLELNWLCKDKDISLPRIVFAEMKNCGGFYVPPEKDEYYFNGTYYEREKGILFIGDTNDDSFVINAIAHEWRHHWQFVSGFDFDHAELNCDLEYKDIIIDYFKSSWTEMDALLFSLEMYPDNEALEWYEWLIE